MEVAPLEFQEMQPLSDDQVMNNAGGYVWAIDDMKRFQRFLCLGVEGGTYYVEEKELALDNAKCIVRIIKGNEWRLALDQLVKCSLDGRAAKQNPTLFALAIFCRQTKNKELKVAAYRAVSDVCRIPTHLFQYLEFCQKASKDGKGWGRAHRKAVANWYLKQTEDPLKLAMHITKYRNRCGWTHRDVLRMCHPKPASDCIGALIRYAVKGLSESKTSYLKDDSNELVKKVFAFLDAVEAVRLAKDSTEVIRLVEEHRLAREHIPTHLLDDAKVWQTLLPHMPMTALIRNLNKLSKLELLNDGSRELGIVLEKLGNEEYLRQARIHPFNVLVALHTYQKGKGERGKLKWPVSSSVVKALDNAFYKCFKFVEPTNKRYLLAVDVSGSMMVPVLGSPAITADCASAAMAMVTLRTERICEVVAFSHRLVNLNLNANMDLENVMKTVQSVAMGGTDCSLPMTWAQSQSKEFDVFIVYTDSETWIGPTHPARALQDYRKALGRPDAKLIVVAMAATEFSIADPNDGGMLDICGFDSAAPEVMRNFVLDLI